MYTSVMETLREKGAMSWAFKYRLGGRESEVIVLTILKQARDTRDKCRHWLDCFDRMKKKTPAMCSRCENRP